MSKFQLGQEVFIVIEKKENKQTKCKDCDGEGKIPSKVEGKTIKCSECNGLGKKYKQHISHKVICSEIESVTVWQKCGEDLVEEYLIGYTYDKIYTTDREKTIDKLSLLEDSILDVGYNNICMQKDSVVLINELFETKEEAVKSYKNSNEKLKAVIR